MKYIINCNTMNLSHATSFTENKTHICSLVPHCLPITGVLTPLLEEYLMVDICCLVVLRVYCICNTFILLTTKTFIQYIFLCLTISLLAFFLIFLFYKFHSFDTSLATNCWLVFIQDSDNQFTYAIITLYRQLKQGFLYRHSSKLHKAVNASQKELKDLIFYSILERGDF